MDPRADRLIERERYDARARALLVQSSSDMGPDGAQAHVPSLRAPYEHYEALIRDVTKPGTMALDLCCGTGLYSLVPARAGAEVTASDIAPANVAVALRRGARAGLTLTGLVADAENVPLPSGTFDLVTCAGSLSYVDHPRFFHEVTRLLRPGGWFVCVDSLDHHPVYRLNRLWNFARGQRTWSTLRRMPTLATVRQLRRCFPGGSTEFFGATTFLAPLLRPLIGEIATARVLNTLDPARHGYAHWGFKFVFSGRRPR